MALNMLQVVAMIDFCAKIRYIHNKFMGYLKCDLNIFLFNFKTMYLTCDGRYEIWFESNLTFYFSKIYNLISFTTYFIDFVCHFEYGLQAPFTSFEILLSIKDTSA